MNSAKDSARRSPIVSDDRVKETLQRMLHLCVHVERRMTVGQIAEQAGLSNNCVSAYLSVRPEAQRQASLGNALSIAVVLGEKAVNQVLALIGYGGATPLEESDAADPLECAVHAMQALGEFCQCTAGHSIEHTKVERAAHAADTIIAEILPFSSAGHAA